MFTQKQHRFHTRMKMTQTHLRHLPPAMVPVLQHPVSLLHFLFETGGLGEHGSSGEQGWGGPG